MFRGTMELLKLSFWLVISAFSGDFGPFCLYVKASSSRNVPSLVRPTDATPRPPSPSQVVPVGGSDEEEVNMLLSTGDNDLRTSAPHVDDQVVPEMNCPPSQSLRSRLRPTPQGDRGRATSGGRPRLWTPLPFNMPSRPRPQPSEPSESRRTVSFEAMVVLRSGSNSSAEQQVPQRGTLETRFQARGHPTIILPRGRTLNMVLASVPESSAHDQENNDAERT